MGTANSVTRDGNHKDAAGRAAGENVAAVQAIDDRGLTDQLALKLGAGSLGDLITPLRDRLQALLGFTEIIAEESNGGLAHDQRRFLDRVRLGLHGLDHSVTNLAEAASAVSGADYVSPQAFALSELAPELVPALRYLCRRRRVALNIEVKYPEVIIVADWRRVRSIVLNLALAVVEHLTDGELTVAIRLADERKRRLSSRVKEQTELELELRGQSPGGARHVCAKSASAKSFADSFKLDCESELSTILARYHVVALGGTLCFSAPSGVAYTLTARIPVTRVTRRPTGARRTAQRMLMEFPTRSVKPALVRRKPLKPRNASEVEEDNALSRVSPARSSAG